METLIAALAYLFHCFTAFALIYSCDKAKLWGELEEPVLNMPKLEEWESQQQINDNNVFFYEKRQEYIEKTICPAHHYFVLKKDIEWHQSDCDEGLFRSFFLQLFSLVFLTQMLIRAEVFESWIIAVLLSIAICSVSCLIIYWIYNNYRRCQGVRIKHFNYNGFENSSNNYIIKKHYEYLDSIKETVYFRHSVRKILFNASLIIYILFFFRIPD